MVLTKSASASDTNSIQSEGVGVNADEAFLSTLGYKQEFKREFTRIELFGVSFSIIGVLPSIASVLVFAIPNGGPIALVWGVSVFLSVVKRLQALIYGEPSGPSAHSSLCLLLCRCPNLAPPCPRLVDYTTGRSHSRLLDTGGYCHGS